MLIFFLCCINCNSNSNSHFSNPVGLPSLKPSVQSLKTFFFKSKLLNFDNIDERVAKEQDIKSIDSLTYTNLKSRPSDQAAKHHFLNSKSKSVFSKSDSYFLLKIDKPNAKKGLKKNKKHKKHRRNHRER